MIKIMVRRLWLTAVIILSVLVGASEDVHGKRYRSTLIVKDTAFMEMVYVHVTNDPKEEFNKERADFEILAIGDKFRWYGGYGDYQLDSIQLADPEWTSVSTSEDYGRLRKELEPITINMLTDLQDSTVHYYGKIFINYYRYEEPVPKFVWSLGDETREVMGYECRKATTHWRGRDWTAWYSDIPVSAGPWKFNGLPGLILRLEDSKGEHMFEAVESKDDVQPIGKLDKLYCKTTREKYNAELREYKEDPGTVINASGMITTMDGDVPFKKKIRAFFNPIELE